MSHYPSAEVARFDQQFARDKSEERSDRYRAMARKMAEALRKVAASHTNEPGVAFVQPDVMNIVRKVLAEWDK